MQHLMNRNSPFPPPLRAAGESAGSAAGEPRTGGSRSVSRRVSSRTVPTVLLVILVSVFWACRGGEEGDGAGDAKTAGIQDTATSARLARHSSKDLPNVVLVAIDSLRPDHLNVNGYRRLTTAYLEDLIPRAAFFSNSYSTSPLGAPATASLLTSIYPPAHGVTEGVSAHQQRAHTIRQLRGIDIPLGTLTPAITLPEVLRQNGYRTYGFSSNPELGPALDLFRGFDTFRHLPNLDAKDLSHQVLEMKGEILEPRPSFLYVQFSDPQKPYHFRHPWFRNSNDPQQQAIGAYDSELGYVDRELLRLHEELGWDHNTLLVIVSTHGEALWDHAQVGHGLSLYNEEMRALLLIFGPDFGIPARTVQTNASLVDVFPTVLDLLQIPDEPRDGLTLTHLLAARPPRGVVQRFRGRTIFGHWQRYRANSVEDEHHLMVVHGPWKMISSPTEEALFHTLDDPGEGTNMLRDEDPETNFLHRALDSFKARSQLDANSAAAPPELTTSEKIERLLHPATGDDDG